MTWWRLADDSRDRLTLARRFLEPSNSTHRQHEALRAFFVDGLPSAVAAARFGLTPGSFRVVVHQFRNRPERDLFAPTAREGRPPGKQSRLREQVVALRKQNLSVHDISRALAHDGELLSPAAVAVILKDEGFAKLPRPADDEFDRSMAGFGVPYNETRKLRLLRRYEKEHLTKYMRLADELGLKVQKGPALGPEHLEDLEDLEDLEEEAAAEVAETAAESPSEQMIAIDVPAEPTSALMNAPEAGDKPAPVTDQPITRAESPARSRDEADDGLRRQEESRRRKERRRLEKASRRRARQNRWRRFDAPVHEKMRTLAIGVRAAMGPPWGLVALMSVPPSA